MPWSRGQMMSSASRFPPILISILISTASFSSSMYGSKAAYSSRVIFCKVQSDSNVFALSQQTQKKVVLHFIDSDWFIYASLNQSCRPGKKWPFYPTPQTRVASSPPKTHGGRIGVETVSQMKIRSPDNYGQQKSLFQEFSVFSRICR